jgi:hypothetical protein
MLSGKRLEVVKCKTLAQFIKEEGIPIVHILKTNIECGEQEVFSAPDFGEVAEKILCIVGEYPQPIPNLKEILEYHGYDFSLNGRNVFTAIRKPTL